MLDSSQRKQNETNKQVSTACMLYAIHKNLLNFSFMDFFFLKLNRYLNSKLQNLNFRYTADLAISQLQNVIPGSGLI